MRVFKPKRKGPKGGKVEYQKWYIELSDHLQAVRRFPAFSDRTVTEELGRKLEKLVALRLAGEQPDVELTRFLEATSPKLRDRLAKIGLLDASRAAGGKALAEHVEAWKKYLKAKGNTEDHAQHSCSRVKGIIAGCGFRTWSDISAGKIQEWLAEQREGSLTAAKKARWGKAWKINRNACRDRFNSEKDFIEDKQRKSRMSIITSNHYGRAMKGFCNWMIRDGRASESPVRFLELLNERTEKKHERRALTTSEVRRLLQAAQPDRAMLYRLAVETGLRANEIRTLTRASFDFASEPPTVSVKAAYSKHRRDDTLPLRKDTADALAVYMAGRMPSAPVFPNMLARTAEMIRVDLKAAGIDYIDEAGRYADFHSLRHTFITALARSGVHPKVAQELARHSTITLTMDKYSHTSLESEVEAIEKLPDFTAEKESARATGTLDETPEKSVAVCVPKQGGFSRFLANQDELENTSKTKQAVTRKPRRNAAERAFACVENSTGASDGMGIHEGLKIP